jgi:hypothetical protein
VTSAVSKLAGAEWPPQLRNFANMDRGLIEPLSKTNPDLNTRSDHSEAGVLTIRFKLKKMTLTTCSSSLKVEGSACKLLHFISSRCCLPPEAMVT